MALQRPIATSFNGGELSPRMGGRVDTAIYQVGVEKAENFVPTVEGAIVKRPGFHFIRDAAGSASWLSEFRFNLAQDYVIEWSDGKLRFFTNGVRIETSPGVPYEVTVPYTATEAPFVSCQQSYDRLYLAHPNHPPARLNRTSATTFTYEVLPLTNGPIGDANVDEAKTVTVSGTTGSITITANSPIFQAGHVGGFFRIEAQDFSTIPAWEAGLKPIAVNDIRRSDGKAYTAVQVGTDARTGSVQPIHTRGAEWDGSQTGKDINDKGPYGVKWEYRHDRQGLVQITAVGSSTSATATVIRRLPDSLTSVPSFRWAHGSLSVAAGWPNIVAAWGGRLIFIRDFELMASVAGDYLNFSSQTSSATTPGDLSFRRTLSTEDPALWAVGDRKLIVGTASRELAVGAINAALAVSGDNIEAVPQSFYGSERVFPVQIGTAAIFVQRSGRKLRQAQYEFGQDRYVAQNMTVWCRHITKGGIRQLCFQKEPEELLIGVRGDGQLIVHPHAPEQEIKGFARILHGNGRIVSAVTVASDDGSSDELWALVERAGGAKSVERMAEWRDDGDPIHSAYFVDSGVQAIAGIGQTHFSGLAHLAGQSLSILADGGVVTGVTCADDGSFDIPASAIPANRPYIMSVGAAYTATVVTLKPELGNRGDTTQGLKQRIVRLALRLLQTTGLRIGVLGGKLDELIDRPSAAYMDAPVPLFDGDTDRAVSGGWDTNGQATFISDVPLPATVVAATPKIDVPRGQ